MIKHDIKQYSEAWFDLRIGLPTASRFSDIITPKTKKLSSSITAYACELAAELFTGGAMNSWGGSNSMQRGTYLEDEAIPQYEFTEQETSKIGFVTDDEKQYGCSPDRLVGEDGLLEIKSINAKDHVAMIVSWHQEKSISPKYIPQVQGQLLVTGRKWCDLVFFHPFLPMLICRIYPDIEVHDILRQGLYHLIKKRDEALEILKTY